MIFKAGDDGVDQTRFFSDEKMRKGETLTQYSCRGPPL
jgi:hypothetical protein